MDYEIERDNDLIIFTATDAPERATGWKDSHLYDPETGRIEFFDAEANDVFHVAVMPRSDLADALDEWTAEQEADAEAEADRAEFERDPYAYYGVRRSDF